MEPQYESCAVASSGRGGKLKTKAGSTLLRA